MVKLRICPPEARWISSNRIALAIAKRMMRPRGRRGAVGGPDILEQLFDFVLDQANDHARYLYPLAKERKRKARQIDGFRRAGEAVYDRVMSKKRLHIARSIRAGAFLGSIPSKCDQRLAADVDFRFDTASPHLSVLALDQGLADVLTFSAYQDAPIAGRKFLDRCQSVCALCSASCRRAAKSVVERRTKGELEHVSTC